MPWKTQLTTLQQALEKTDLEAINLRIDLVRLKTLIQSPQQRRGIHSFIARIQRSVDIWNEAAALPGILQYVRDQKNDQSISSADFTGMRDAAITLQTTIFNSFPRDVGTGAVLFETDDSEGRLTQLTFTPAQMAPLDPLIDNVIAEIEVS